MASIHRPSEGNPGDKELVDIYEGYRDNFVAPGESEDKYEPFGARRIVFVHLAEARWQTAAGPSLPSNGTYWRGKLSSIDGFWMGALKTEPN